MRRSTRAGKAFRSRRSVRRVYLRRTSERRGSSRHVYLPEAAESDHENAMLSVEGAQPIRAYEPPISIVWTQGEPCTQADCVLLTAALAGGDADIIEYGRWGVYN